MIAGDDSAEEPEAAPTSDTAPEPGGTTGWEDGKVPAAPAGDAPADDPTPTVGGTALDGVTRRLQSASRPEHDGVVTYLDVLIVAAVEVEWDALNEVFPGMLRARYRDGLNWGSGLHVGWLTARKFEYRVGLLRGYGSGALRTLPGLLKTVGALRPQLLIMVGIAAGRQGHGLELGDIVFAEEIISVEIGRRGDTEWPTRTVSIGGDLTVRARDYADSRPPGSVPVHIGQVIAQHDLVREAPAPRGRRRNYRDALFQRFPKAIALEMEGGALTMACDGLDRGTEPILVKAIVDWADGDKDDSFQPIAARNAATFVRGFLEDAQRKPRPPDRAAMVDRAARRDSDDDIDAPGEADIDEGYLSSVAEAFYQDDAFGEMRTILLRNHAVLVCSSSAANVRRISLALAAGLSRSVSVAGRTELERLARGRIAPGHTYVVAPDAMDAVDPAVPSRVAAAGSYLIVGSVGTPSGSAARLRSAEWHFYPRELIAPALLQEVRAVYGPQAGAWLSDALADAAVAQAVDELSDLAALARAAEAADSAARHDWSLHDYALALADSGRSALLEKLGACASSEQQAWLIAVGLLQGSRRGWIEEAASTLARMVAPDAPPDQPVPLAFVAGAGLVQAIGGQRRTIGDGHETLILKGVDPGTLAEVLWTEYVGLHDTLLGWYEAVIRSAGDADIPGAARLLATAIRAKPSPGMDIADAMLRERGDAADVLRRIAVVDMSLSALSAGEADGMVFSRMAGWMASPGGELRLRVVAVLAGGFGLRRPAIAVELLSRLLRTSANGIERRAAIQGMGLLLSAPQGQREVFERLGRWMAFDWVRNAAERHTRAESVLDAVVRITEAAMVDGHDLSPELTALAADLFEQLAGLAAARQPLRALLQRLQRLPEEARSGPAQVFKYLAASSGDVRGRALAGRASRAVQQSRRTA